MRSPCGGCGVGVLNLLVDLNQFDHRPLTAPDCTLGAKSRAKPTVIAVRWQACASNFSGRGWRAELCQCVKTAVLCGRPALVAGQIPPPHGRSEYGDASAAQRMPSVTIPNATCIASKSLQHSRA